MMSDCTTASAILHAVAELVRQQALMLVAVRKFGLGPLLDADDGIGSALRGIELRNGPLLAQCGGSGG
jgi:hypothetical protein